MRIDSVVSVHGAHPVNAPHRANSAAATQASGFSSVDQLDISREADQVSRAREGGIRYDRVSQIRAEIEAGVYETPEKIDAALDRLLDAFNV